MFRRIRHAASLGALVFATAAWAQPAPITSAALNGPWELRSLCTNDHGRQAGCSKPEKHALRLVFSPAGTWRIAMSDSTAPARGGFFEIRKDNLILKNADGSFFEQWHMDYASDGNHLVITNKRAIQTFERITTSTE